MHDSRRDANLSDVMRAVGILYRRATRTFDQDQSSLPVGTRSVLELLALTAPQTVPRIAKTLLLSRQFVQRSVDYGVDQGFLEFQENQAHRRSRLVSVTVEGRTTIEGVLRREQEHFADARDQLTEDEISTCLHVLNIIRDQTDWRPATEGGGLAGNEFA